MLTPDQWAKIRRSIMAQLDQHLEGNETAILDAIKRARENHNGDRPLIFPISLACKLIPTPEQTGVKTSIAFGTKTKCEDECLVRHGTPDLVDMAR